jgi:hypothetical protein
MARQQRLAVGDKAFEMSASDPHFFELAGLPISFTIELGGTRLPSSASEPRMRGDARDAEGDPVLHGDVSVANVDRADCRGELLEVRVTRDEQYVRKRVRPHVEGAGYRSRIVDHERLGQRAQARLQSSRFVQPDILEAPCHQLRAELILQPQQLGRERTTLSQEVTCLPKQRLVLLARDVLCLSRCRESVAECGTRGIQRGPAAHCGTEMFGEAGCALRESAEHWLAVHEGTAARLQVLQVSFELLGGRLRGALSIFVIPQLGLGFVEESFDERGRRLVTNDDPQRLRAFAHARLSGGLPACLREIALNRRKPASEIQASSVFLEG